VRFVKVVVDAGVALTRGSFAGKGDLGLIDVDDHLAGCGVPRPADRLPGVSYLLPSSLRPHPPVPFGRTHPSVRDCRLVNRQRGRQESEDLVLCCLTSSVVRI
jgi:hypothetical protein